MYFHSLNDALMIVEIFRKTASCLLIRNFVRYFALSNKFVEASNRICEYRFPFNSVNTVQKANNESPKNFFTYFCKTANINTFTFLAV